LDIWNTTLPVNSKYENVILDYYERQRPEERMIQIVQEILYLMNTELTLTPEVRELQHQVQELERKLESINPELN
jgi:16S rRNA C967 or C1407 C5-methylase (RsmB/RsmF family)